MSKQIECKDNSGFEDMLSVGQHYAIIERMNNSYLVSDDKGVRRWFGDIKFEVVL